MLDELVSSLLYEGYALYPYTPGATKNATPTPFGIVYPPSYAAECHGAHDHARLECVAEPASGATLTVELRYLAPTGERHEAAERRVELGPAALGARCTTAFDGGHLTVAFRVAAGWAHPCARLRAQHDRRGPRPRSGGGAAARVHLHPPRRAPVGRALHLAPGERR